MNVHPGETWDEQFAAVRDHALRIKRLVNRPGPFGLGLRLSWTAAQTLAVPARLDAFGAFCRANDLYVFTINGFPYGRFHDGPVKTDVYRPDWRQRERLDYTNVLTDILAALLPEGVNGSVSTVPGSYKPWITTDADLQSLVANIADAAAHAAATLARTGRSIVIALEPEPDCLIENTPETIAFFTGPLREWGIAHLRRQRGMSAEDAGATLARHVGVCFDTAHLAVAFEDLADSLDRLRAAGVPVSKIHLGAALGVRDGADAPAALRNFCEDVYLHQTRRQSPDGSERAFADLPEALAAPGAADERWRVHFHVPLFFEGRGDLLSTRSLLAPRFVQRVASGATEHLEIETYTYGVLPADLAAGDLAESIAREYRWVLSHLPCVPPSRGDGIP
jgi:sugar phosphate isomerase/epimerase